MVTILIAVAIGVGVFGISMWVIRMLATPPPPEPDADDALEMAVDYRCSVCGMKLTVTEAYGAVTAAPMHCREEMMEA